MDYEVIPIELSEANVFITMFHRHNKPVKRAKFQLGLMQGREMIGVAIMGRPVARMLDDKRTLEILRTCIKPNHPNANSKLYARVRRIAQMMGYNKVITYTLKSESQSTLKAIGAVPVAETRPHKWDCPSRHREDQPIYAEPKIRWELTTASKGDV